MKDILRITNLVKNFGTVQAVNINDLSLPEGEVVGLIGKNGSGKTTLMQMIAGLLIPTKGKVEVFDLHHLNDFCKIKKDIGFVSSDIEPYKWMTIQELFKLYKEAYKTWDNEYSFNLLKRLDLDKESAIKDLSLGALAKLKLVLAISHRPKLLIIDEVTAGIDATVRQSFMGEIGEVVIESGATVLISSHIIQDIERIANRVLIMQDGKIILNRPLDYIKTNFKKVKAVFKNEIPTEVDYILCMYMEKNKNTVLMYSEDSYIEKKLTDLGAAHTEFLDWPLEDIFVQLHK